MSCLLFFNLQKTTAMLVHTDGKIKKMTLTEAASESTRKILARLGDKTVQFIEDYITENYPYGIERDDIPKVIFQDDYMRQQLKSEGLPRLIGKYAIPTWAIPAITDDDYSALDDDDEKEVKAFLQRVELRDGFSVDVTTEQYQAIWPDLGNETATVRDCYFYSHNDIRS